MKNFFDSNKVRSILRIILALTIGLGFGFIITLFVSEEPIEAYKAFLFGPLSQLNRIGDWLEESLTLIFLGLAVTIVFNAKQFYIGLEGQMILSALASGAVAIYLPVDPIIRIPAAFLAGIAVSVAWAIIPAVLKAYLNASELVTSLMFNTIALKLFEYLLRTYLQLPKTNGIMSERVPAEARLTTFIPNLPFLAETRAAWIKATSVTWIVYVAIAAIALAYILLYKTKFGYEIRAVGANNKFAKYGGINVNRTVVSSILVSGIFAGLAGTHLVLAITERVVQGMAFGFGFEGINIAILTGNNPLGVPIASLFYGYLRAGSDVMERTSDVSRELVFVVQAAVLLLITAERLLPMVQKVVTTDEEEAIQLEKGSAK
jgi:simple sugar transport system permease protein